LDWGDRRCDKERAGAMTYIIWIGTVAIVLLTAAVVTGAIKELVKSYDLHHR
jgi:hypothetical protein